jgi:integrase
VFLPFLKFAAIGQKRFAEILPKSRCTMNGTNRALQSDRPKRWDGGRIRWASDGTPVFQIERMVNGINYYRTLDARNEKEARAELALFERDPEGYRTTDEAKTALGVHVTTDPGTVARFLAWLRQEGRVERYVKNTQHYLAEWEAFLKGRDLRRVALWELRAELKRRGAAKSRIIALKSFAAYLREQEAVLTSKEDPTLDLRVPPPRPARAKRDKGYTLEHVEALYRAINPWKPAFDPPREEWENGRTVDVQSVRDVLVLHCKTGMHASEMERLARGEGELQDVTGEGEIAGTLRVVHTSGRVHAQSLDAQSLAAAKRLQARGSAPADSYVRRVIQHSVTQANWAARRPLLKPITFGALRRSFVTWAAERGELVRPSAEGVPLAAIASAIGHTSAHTTKRFDEGVRVPPMIKVPIRLEHPDDPEVT